VSTVASGRPTGHPRSWDPGGQRVLMIRLLGDPDIRLAGERLGALDAPRVRSLLTYLLLYRGTPQPRGHVAFLLWPDSTEPQARTNLRQLLHHLRSALPDPDRFLHVDTWTIGWRGDAPYWLDVEAFESAVTRAARAAGPEQERDALTEAASHYGGALLPQCYEEWILPERERLRETHVDVLERLTDLLEDERDYRVAIQHAQELLRCDPLHEATYRRLMRLHALAGERARALRVYHTCVTTLERELGVEPGQATREVYASLLRVRGEAAHHVHRAAPAAPLVGREPAWSECVRAFREAASQRPHALLVQGEAGIGKTRLVEEFELWCRRQGHAIARARAYPAEGHLAYAPVVEWLLSTPLRSFRRRIDEVWLAEISRLLPEVRSERPDLPQPVAAPAAEGRQRLFNALAQAVLSTAAPLVLVLEDVHWCDRETLEFLHYLVRSGDDTALLVFLTLRPEEIDVDHPASELVSSLQRLEVLTTVELGPLGRDEVGELSANLRGWPSSPAEAAALHEDTGGNPLFVVETLREEREPAATTPATRTVGDRPSRLRALIERRLGLLSPGARDIASLAGVIGREFTYEVLREASGRDDAELVEILDELWRRRVIREHGAAAYDFVHDRIREVAARLIGPARARAVHHRIVTALERLHAGDLDPVSAQLARHLEAAGERERALAAYRRAAAHAQRMSGIAQAADLLGRALALVDALPAGRDRDVVELELQTALGVALVALEGYGGAGALEVYRRAQQLCERLARPVEPPILRGLAIGAVVRAELDDAERFGQQLLVTAAAHGDDLLRVEGSYVLGVTAFWRGAFSAARQHLEAAIERYDPAAARTHLRLYAQDPKVVCLARLSYNLWYLGDVQRACALRDDALALADQLDDPTSSVYALLFAARLADEVGETDEFRRFATATAAAAEEHQLGFFTPLGLMLTGWVEALAGHQGAGIASIRQGLSRYEDSGQPLIVSYGLALLTRAHLAAGDPAAGQLAADDALERTERTGLRYLEADLLRLRGRCLAGRGDRDGALAAFDRALDVAREQGSPTLALRAATARAALLAADGRAVGREALTTLAAVRERILDGYDTADVRSADALLREAGVA
jgi:DNA-binding SARP family transcriptional activator/tetratricopeptide (TPR) repeat protein